jgi:hypothetical protein
MKDTERVREPGPAEPGGARTPGAGGPDAVRRDGGRDRRRFLRDAVPLLLGVAGAAAGGEGGQDLDIDPLPATSPPPEATDAAPAPVRKNIEERQADFARDNPGLTRYPYD